MVSTIQILEDARSIVEYGWTKYDYEDSEGCYCSIGACRVAAFGAVSLRTDQIWSDGTAYKRTELYNCYMDALNILRSSLPGEFFRIDQYNDDPETTQDDVLDLFNRAISQARNA